MADSGALIGLPRSDLESTLETLECMAGEIGASVIVVKEIEVPKGMHVLGGDKAALFAGEIAKRLHQGSGGVPSESESTTTSTDDEDNTLFSMDPETDLDPVSIDLEISTVYKPRPIRFRSSRNSPQSFKHKLNPKKKHHWNKDEEQRPQGQTKQQAKAMYRQQVRDQRREEKMQELVLAANGTDSVSGLVGGLESLHLHLDIASVPVPVALPDSTSSYSSDIPSIAITSGFNVNKQRLVDDEPRLIVEALVVRKLSLEEAFLDFGGFSLI